MALSNVKAVVADLGAPDKLLEIDGSAAGAAAGIPALRGGQPGGRLDRPLHRRHAAPPATRKLALKLQLPLAHLPDTKVQGSLQLLNNDVVLFNDLPPVQAAHRQDRILASAAST